MDGVDHNAAPATFVVRPGATPSDNIYATFATAHAAAVLASGWRRIILDGSLNSGIVPVVAGTYAMAGIELVALDVDQTEGGSSTPASFTQLQLADGAVLTNLYYARNVGLLGPSSGSTFPLQYALTSSHLARFERCRLTASTGGPKLLRVSGAFTLTIDFDGCRVTANGGNTTLSVATGSTLAIRALATEIADGVLHGAAGATVSSVAIDATSSVDLSTMSSWAGNALPTPTFLDEAEYIAFDPTGRTYAIGTRVQAALEQLDDAIVAAGGSSGGSALNYRGTWNATTNSPDIASIAAAGDYWRVSVAGSTSLDGITDWGVDDWAVKPYPSGNWQKVDNAEPDPGGQIAAAIAAHEAASDPHTGYQKESEKGQASGYASLNASSKVVEDPANATATPTASKIPIAGAAGELAAGFLATFQTLVDGATIAVNWASGRRAKVTIGGDRTLGTPTNPTTGGVYELLVVQDGTGARELTFPSTFLFTPGPKREASASTFYRWVYDGTNYIPDGDVVERTKSVTTTTYTATDQDHRTLLLCTHASGCTVTLPGSTGRRGYQIRAMQDGGGAVTFARAGSDTIGQTAATSISTTSNGDIVGLMLGPSTNWKVLERVPNIQIFTSSGTYTKPPSCSVITSIGVGGGGGGGGGRKGASLSSRSGGGGGAGGGWAIEVIAASLASTTESVTVGAGGAGGAGATSNDSNGSAGSAGTSSTFGSLMRAAGGAAGGAGQTTGGAGAAGVQSGGTGGEGNAASSGPSAGSRGDRGGSGGGGGGAIGTSDNLRVPMAGGDVSQQAAASGGGGTAGAGADGGNGSAVTANRPVGGAGGGGGAASTSGNAWNGGNGGKYGGGGGGGGAAMNSTGNGGTGGNGADGIVIVVSE